MATAKILVGPTDPARVWGITRAAGWTPGIPSSTVLVAKADTPKTGQLLLAIAAIVAILVLSFILDDQILDPNFTATAQADESQATPVEGLTIFAVFFVAALALERFLEPLSKVLLPAEKTEDATKDKQAKAQEAARKLLEGETEQQNNTAAAAAAAAAAVEALAQAKANEEATHQQRVILFWALATVLAMVASATLNLYFLRTVGIAEASRQWEILATGLIIGAGTKPLHDLVTMIQAKTKVAQSDADAATTSP